MEKRKVSDELETEIGGEICDVDDSGISFEDVENKKHNDNEDRLDDALMDKQFDNNDYENKQFDNNECLDDGVQLDKGFKASDTEDLNAKDRGTNEETGNSSDKKSYASAMLGSHKWTRTKKLRSLEDTRQKSSSLVG
ncbi:hypothetical protein Tco_0770445 [Tanacetum coccineum]|uniref:Uncharacterized protein n=1 Tax=Tanacetum coccineum TaxID=301880 RepID=A0ABQ4ZC88_9ASTR